MTASPGPVKNRGGGPARPAARAIEAQVPRFEQQHRADVACRPDGVGIRWIGIAGRSWTGRRANGG
jgi:hypothetical protein